MEVHESIIEEMNASISSLTCSSSDHKVEIRELSSSPKRVKFASLTSSWLHDIIHSDKSHITNEEDESKNEMTGYFLESHNT